MEGRWLLSLLAVCASLAPACRRGGREVAVYLSIDQPFGELAARAAAVV